MGLMDNIRKQIGSQFIEILEWLDDSRATRWSTGFRSTTRRSRWARSSWCARTRWRCSSTRARRPTCSRPGTYTLSTQNVPILTTLRGWKYGFQSPFKAEVYFFNTRLFTDLKWGTTNPVMMRDTEFGMIRLRAFGTYAMRIARREEVLRDRRRHAAA